MAVSRHEEQPLSRPTGRYQKLIPPYRFFDHHITVIDPLATQRGILLRGDPILPDALFDRFDVDLEDEDGNIPMTAEQRQQGLSMLAAVREAQRACGVELPMAPLAPPIVLPVRQRERLDEAA